MTSPRAARRRALLPATVAVTFGTFTAAAPGAARAEDNRAAADALFEAGRALYDAGRFEEACPKLRASQEASAAGGTLLLLGMCHAKLGKTASAEAELRSALATARRDRRPDRERLAAKILESIAGRAPRAMFAPPSSPETIRIRLDGGAPLGRDALDVPLPVDPGPHEVVVEADAHEAASMRFDAPDAPELVRVELPAPSPRRAHDPAPAPTTAPAPTSRGSSPHPVGTYTALGASALAFGAGAFFGVRAIQLDDEARALCEPSRCASAEGLAKNDDARTSATLANVAIGVGIAALVTGVVFWLTDAKEPARAARGLSLSF